MLYRFENEITLTKSAIHSILDTFKTEIYQPNIFQTILHGNAINCLNGTLHFQEGVYQLKQHDKLEYYREQIPVAYDPLATAPIFKKFLEDIFAGDSDALAKQQALLAMMGYTLLRSTAFERFIILYGHGANGKSVCLKLLEALIGKSNVCAVSPAQFDNRFQRAYLNGKLANIVTEIAEGEQLADSALKAIVSGETMTVEHKHCKPFDFSPYATLWFGSNHLPKTRDHSNATFRRAIILTFNRYFEGKDRDIYLFDKLSKELPGILNMVLGALTHALNKECIDEPPSSLEIKKDWQEEVDSVLTFINEECVLSPSSQVYSIKVYNTYSEWCKNEGISPIPKRTLTNRLRKYGVIPHKGVGGQRMLKGISIISRDKNE